MGVGDSKFSTDGGDGARLFVIARNGATARNNTTLRGWGFIPTKQSPPAGFDIRWGRLLRKARNDRNCAGDNKFSMDGEGWVRGKGVGDIQSKKDMKLMYNRNKRMNTRIEKIISACKHWEDSLTAGLIASELKAFSKNSSPLVIKKFMDENSYDVIGLYDEKRLVKGYCKADEIINSVNDVEFRLNELVTENTPISECLFKLQGNDRLFVLGKSTVDKIITLADLDKQPVRLLFFGTISHIEMLMLELIREKFHEEKWSKILGKKRFEIVKALFNERVANHQELELIDCTQFCDKRKILKSNLDLMHDLGFQSKSLIENFLKELETIRNSLAHAQVVSDNKRLCLLYPRCIEFIECLYNLVLAKSQCNKLKKKKGNER